MTREIIVFFFFLHNVIYEFILIVGVSTLLLYISYLPNKTHFSYFNVIYIFGTEKTCWEVLFIITKPSCELCK